MRKSSATSNRNQKSLAGNFSIELYGTTGRSNGTMKTSTGSSYITSAGTPVAVLAIPRQEKSTTGI